ncbi:MAG: hypothetical protein HUJ70_13035, partial [Pseudobutyrivibrio sp.]|nr:hypothetical protein [Pseudobutyrivibrio sp.]
MKKSVLLRKISCVLLFAMVIGCFDPWLLEVDAAKSEHTVATDEELINPKDIDLELNIDDNPEANDPMAAEELRDSEEFCGEPVSLEELEEQGIDYENNEKNKYFAPSGYAMGGSDGYSRLVYGVDVSKYQGAMNWDTARSNGVEFAFIRAAYRGTSDGKLYDDPYVYNYIEGAYDAGIAVGLYCFSQAVTVAEAEAEADRLVAFANSRPGRIKLPLVMDYEYGAGHTGRLAAANHSKDQATTIIKAFCKRVEDQGYKAMVYANKSTLEGSMNAGQLGYDVWLARYMYDGNAGSGFTNHEAIKNLTTFSDEIYSGDFEFWQCSSKGKGSAFGASSTYIDLDFWFCDTFANLETDVLIAPTDDDGVHYDLNVPDSWWYRSVFVEVPGSSVDKIMSPEMTPITGTDNVHINLDLYTDNATRMKVRIINGYGEYLYELVYKLTYSNGKYTAVLDYVNDFMFYLNSWPAGYDDDHAYIDNEKVYQVCLHPVWGKYIMALGRDMALDQQEHQVIIVKTDNADRKLERKIYNLRFNNTSHSYDVDPVITDYFPLLLTPPSGYDTENPQIWVDGIAYDATKVDGKWKIPLGAPMKESQEMRVVTVYSYNDKGMPTGMTVYKLTFDMDHVLAEMTEFKD